MAHIEKVFSGRFKEQKTPDSVWTPFPEEKLPKPRLESLHVSFFRFLIFLLEKCPRLKPAVGDMSGICNGLVSKMTTLETSS